MEARLKPLRVMCTLCSMWPLSKSKLSNFCIVFFVLLVAVCAIVRQFLESVLTTRGIVITWVEFTQYNCRIISTAFCLIFTNVKAQNVVDFFAIVEELHVDFAKWTQQTVDYGKLPRFVRIVVAIVVGKVVLQQFAIFYDMETLHPLDYVVYNVPIIFQFVLLAQWMVYNEILRSNLKTLNKALISVSLGQTPRLALIISDLNGPKTGQDKLITCGIIYKKLCTATAKLNKGFAWQILLLIPTFFLLINFNSFQVCQIIKKRIEFAPAWLLFDFYYFFMFLQVIVPCILVKDESDKFGEILHRIETTSNKEYELNSLILQTYHEQIEFSACGIFALDGSLVYSFLGALTTYLVILLQFDV